LIALGRFNYSGSPAAQFRSSRRLPWTSARSPSTPWPLTARQGPLGQHRYGFSLLHLTRLGSSESVSGLLLPPFRHLQAIDTHSACFRASNQLEICLLIYLSVAGLLRASVVLNWLLLSCCTLLPLLITTGGCHPQVRLCQGAVDTPKGTTDGFGHCLHAANSGCGTVKVRVVTSPVAVTVAQPQKQHATREHRAAGHSCLNIIALLVMQGSCGCHWCWCWPVARGCKGAARQDLQVLC
jgi:hypothetical protein